MSVDWDCWIADETGSPESKILLEDGYQPDPLPLPRRNWSGTLHELTGPGAANLQSFGYGPETLEVNLRVRPDVWFAIAALVARFEDGEHKQVQFYNSFATYLCTSIGNLQPTMANRNWSGDGLVTAQLQLLIHSEVEEE